MSRLIDDALGYYYEKLEVEANECFYYYVKLFIEKGMEYKLTKESRFNTKYLDSLEHFCQILRARFSVRRRQYRVSPEGLIIYNIL